MTHLQYNITKGACNSKRTYRVSFKGFNPNSWNMKSSTSTENTKSIIESPVKCADSNSPEPGNGSSTDYTNKEEKNYRRLLIEKRDLERKKSNIENRLVEIKNDMDRRREKIRSGRVSDSWK
jgi:hypothetical protein